MGTFSSIIKKLGERRKQSVPDEKIMFDPDAWPQAGEIRFDEYETVSKSTKATPVIHQRKIELVNHHDIHMIDIMVDDQRVLTISEEMLASINTTTPILRSVIESALVGHPPNAVISDEVSRALATQLMALKKRMEGPPSPPKSNLMSAARQHAMDRLLHPIVQPSAGALAGSVVGGKVAIEPGMWHDPTSFPPKPTLYELAKMVAFHNIEPDSSASNNLHVQLYQSGYGHREISLPIVDPKKDQHRIYGQQLSRAIEDTTRKIADTVCGKMFGKYKRPRVAFNGKQEKAYPEGELFETILVELSGQRMRLAFAPRQDITPYQMYLCRKVLEGLVPKNRLAFIVDNGLMDHWQEAKGGEEFDLDDTKFFEWYRGLHRRVCTRLW